MLRKAGHKLDECRLRMASGRDMLAEEVTAGSKAAESTSHTVAAMVFTVKVMKDMLKSMETVPCRRRRRSGLTQASLARSTSTNVRRSTPFAKPPHSRAGDDAGQL